jgi:hypothetical protein
VRSAANGTKIQVAVLLVAENHARGFAPCLSPFLMACAPERFTGY